MRIFIFILLCGCLGLQAQKLHPVTHTHNETLPDWAVEMYGPQPNVWRVDDGYLQWRATHPADKTTFSQYYKKWRRAARPFVQADGFIHYPTAQEKRAFEQRLAQLKTHQADNAQGVWTHVGPIETFNTNTGPNPLAKSEQANVYCIDQSPSHPDVVYCGTEGSEIFKSTNRGLNWTCVSRNYDVGSPTALEVHPSNPDTVLAGSGWNIWRSTDGGLTWAIVFEVPDASPNEILYHPTNPQIVLAATWKGLYRSDNGGVQWTQIFPEACYDIEWKTDDANTIFAVRNDPNDKICRFARSTDTGLTWTVENTGWLETTDPGRNDGGARLAVSKADPNRVYAILIGEAKAGDDGFIGLYRSDDAGLTWTLPNPPAGGPYNNEDHPNMATIGTTGGYHQGFYNLGLDVSDTNPDELLVGFLNLWVSTDGATSFDCIGGYCGNDFNYVHPDCQEIEINGDDLWMTSDGGVEYSDDFFDTHYARNRGITSSDFWGFGAGWNEDILVGGRYHNGNTALAETWEPGESLGLGGGEAPTGYVNPGANREAYFSDLGGRVIPLAQNGFVENVSAGKFPNESYYAAESGEMEWDPRCWNVFYTTKENKLWRTEDGGKNWSVLHAFGTNTSAQAHAFEISRSNPQVMYLFQRNADSWTPGKLWKTVNGGANWVTLPLPSGFARRMVLAISTEDENVLWAAYPDGSNGQKVFMTTNGGQTWQNLTTPALDGESVSYIMHQSGTDGGLYLGTNRTIWYKNNTMPDWVPYNEGLPKSIATCILRPFYRDGKLRMAAYGKGIWEVPFYEPSRPVAQPMVNKRLTSCPGDTIRFDDYSTLLHEGATWYWEFPGGNPATSNLRQPKVTYAATGVYDVSLTVTNAYGSSTKTVPAMIEVQDFISNSLEVSNDFSNGLDNFTVVNPDGGITWEPTVITTCEPAGDTAYYVHNYVYSSYGQDEMVLPVNLNLTQVIDPELRFRVAYAPYYDGNAFIDSMKVLVSDDCGAYFATIFRSGGEALSTTTSGTGPNNLYEYDEYSPASCDEWRDITLDLSAYEGKYITVKFLSQSGYGNNLYLDDIVLTGTMLVSTTNPNPGAFEAQAVPNPSNGATQLTGISGTEQTLRIALCSTTGQVLWQTHKRTGAGAWNLPLPTETLPSGVYWVKIGTEKGEWQVLKLVRG